MNCGSRKQAGKLVLIQKSYTLNDCHCLWEVGCSSNPPQVEILDKPNPNLDWQKLKKREQKMGLQRKESIGRLDKVSLSHSTHFAGHPQLIIVGSQMLNDRVGENHLKASFTHIQ